MKFEDLGLAEPILEGVRSVGYERPTDIQRQAIPLALQGRDIIGLGQTGSGKTAAFGLPILNLLCDRDPGVRALILVPTRELCVQVAEALREYAQHSGIEVRTAFGGIDIGIQEAAFKRGMDVVVACPGRLIDHLERGNLHLRDLEVLVLDEADRMLDMGFMPQIRSIFVRCPDERQNLLFSATMPPEVEDLCSRFLSHAERVQVGKRSQAASTIQHRFVGVKGSDKMRYLKALLHREDGRVLIFAKRKIGADQLGRDLKRAGLPADSIHGDKSAESRHVVLRAFEAGRIKHLVATDVAARGLDIDDVQLVVNYDLPMQVEDYIHRVGRTGRVGRSGRAISLVAPPDRGMHKQILAHLRRTSKEGAETDEDKQPPKRSDNGSGRSDGRGRRRKGGGNLARK